MILCSLHCNAFTVTFWCIDAPVSQPICTASRQTQHDKAVNNKLCLHPQTGCIWSRHSYSNQSLETSLPSRHWGAKKTQIWPYFQLQKFCSATETKLNTGAQPQTFPQPMIPKSFLYFYTLIWKLLAQTLPFKSDTDKNLFKVWWTKMSVFTPSQWRANHSLIKLGMW